MLFLPTDRLTAFVGDLVSSTCQKILISLKVKHTISENNDNRTNTTKHGQRKVQMIDLQLDMERSLNSSNRGSTLVYKLI